MTVRGQYRNDPRFSNMVMEPERLGFATLHLYGRWKTVQTL